MSIIANNASRPLLVELDVVGREKTSAAIVRTKPPVLIGEFKVVDCGILREAEFYPGS